jgi:hypothetical protein
MSALPPKADMDPQSANFRFVPIADISPYKSQPGVQGCEGVIVPRNLTRMDLVG